MSYTLEQASLLSPYLGDEEIAALFSTEADIAAMLKFEQCLAEAQAETGLIPHVSAAAIANAIKSISLDITLLRNGIARDGMAVPNLVAQLRALLPDSAKEHLHFGSTSQDVIDTSLMIRSRAAFAILQDRLKLIHESLKSAADQFGHNTLFARTRMQKALPASVADRVKAWDAGFQSAADLIGNLTFPVQFGGPTGILRNEGLKKALAEKLSLNVLPHTWQAERSPVVALANAASALTGAAGKFGMDVCLMAQNELAEISLAVGGTSSAMHHKKNPVSAEALVTLARFNATLVSAMHQAIVHEQERSGAAWTLEWMVLPQMLVAAGSGTRLTAQILKTISKIGFD